MVVGEGSLQEPSLTEHPKTTLVSLKESLSPQKRRELCTVDSVVKKKKGGDYKIFPLFSLHINKQPPLIILRQSVTIEGGINLTEENKHQNEYKIVLWEKHDVSCHKKWF